MLAAPQPPMNRIPPGFFFRSVEASLPKPSTIFRASYPGTLRPFGWLRRWMALADPAWTTALLVLFGPDGKSDSAVDAERQ